MKLTMPQILMLNHAAAVHSRRYDKKRKANSPQEEEDPSVVDNMNSDEMAAYIFG